jgi:hypothetical protein
MELGSRVIRLGRDDIGDFRNRGRRKPLFRRGHRHIDAVVGDIDNAIGKAFGLNEILQLGFLDGV